jgi:hypothetical protein
LSKKLILIQNSWILAKLNWILGIFCWVESKIGEFEQIIAKFEQTATEIVERNSVFDHTTVVRETGRYSNNMAENFYTTK